MINHFKNICRKFNQVVALFKLKDDEKNAYIEISGRDSQCVKKIWDKLDVVTLYTFYKYLKTALTSIVDILRLNFLLLLFLSDKLSSNPLTTDRFFVYFECGL